MPARLHAWLHLAAIVAAALCFPAGIEAQAIISARAGLLNNVEGCVLLDGKHLESGRARLIHLLPGQRLRTENGHAEVMLGPEVFLRLGFYAEIEVVSTDLTAPQARIWSGSALVDANGLTDQKPVSILVNDTEVGLVRKGLYRFDMPSEGPHTINVKDGRAVIVSSSRKKTVLEKHEVELDANPGEFVVRKVERSDTDALDQWSSERASAIARVNGEMLRKLAEEERQNKRSPFSRSGFPWWP